MEKHEFVYKLDLIEKKMNGMHTIGNRSWSVIDE